MNSAAADAKRAELITALCSAYDARHGATPGIEPVVRAYARALREAGVPIGQALIEMKDLLRRYTGIDEPNFTPKVIGWAVTGYFAQS